MLLKPGTLPCVLKSVASLALPVKQRLEPSSAFCPECIAVTGRTVIHNSGVLDQALRTSGDAKQSLSVTTHVWHLIGGTQHFVNQGA